MGAGVGAGVVSLLRSVQSCALAVHVCVCASVSESLIEYAHVGLWFEETDGPVQLVHLYIQTLITNYWTCDVS